MKVLLSGYYGFGNVGDESVLQAVVQGLREHDPNIEITVLSASPKLTKELNQVNSIYRYKWLSILAEMLKTDVFISGGGTLFQNVTSNRSFLYYIVLILLAKLLLKKVVIFAQGFGPLTGRINRGLARFVLNRVNLITLRDKDSYEEIVKLGVKRSIVHVTADSSAILKIHNSEEGRRILSLEAVKMDKPLIGISVRSMLKKGEGKLYGTLSEAIDWLSKIYNYSPVFILFQCPEDMAEASKIINHMQGKSDVIFRICRPNEMLAIISNFDILIGMRLHSLIFAAMNHIPMLGLSYDPKVEAFMKEIKQPYLKVGADLNLGRLKDMLGEIVSNKENIKKNMEAKGKELYGQAKKNFDLFFESFPQVKS